MLTSPLAARWERAWGWFVSGAVYAFMWGVLALVAGDDALPGGHLFALAVLFAASVVCGALSPLLRLPPLLGMLLVRGSGG